jgi:hypothetical protein
MQSIDTYSRTIREMLDGAKFNIEFYHRDLTRLRQRQAGSGSKYFLIRRVRVGAEET